MRKLIFIFGVLFSLVIQAQTPITLNELKAFPTADGYGKNVNGGRNGVVLKVNNLNDSGTGSLRAALEDSRNATIIFEVAGVIFLRNIINPKSNKYVAGQTAFRNGGQGITITMDPNNKFDDPLIGNNVASNGFGNTIWRFIRFARGTGVPGEKAGDNFEPWTTGTANPDTGHIIDHCSFRHGVDETLSFASAKRVTIMNTLVYEGLLYATHDVSINGNSGHSKGSLIGNTPEVTIYRCGYFNNDDRNPLIQPGSAGVKYEFINNVIYNRGNFGMQLTTPFGGAYEANIINNLWKDGPNSRTNRYGFLFVDTPDNGQFGTGQYNPEFGNHRLYLQGNISPQRPTDNTKTDADNWRVVGAWDDNTNAANRTTHQTSSMHNFNIGQSKITDVSSLVDDLKFSIGATLNGFQDTHDIRQWNEFENNTGTIINADGDTRTGGRPGTIGQFTAVTGGIGTLQGMSSVPVDSNNDGIPDNFVSSYTITNNAGYTPLELYLAELAGDFATLTGVDPGPTNPGGANILTVRLKQKYRAVVLTNF